MNELIRETTTYKTPSSNENEVAQQSAMLIGGAPTRCIDCGQSIALEARDVANAKVAPPPFSSTSSLPLRKTLPIIVTRTRRSANSGEITGLFCASSSSSTTSSSAFAPGSSIGSTDSGCVGGSFHRHHNHAHQPLQCDKCSARYATIKTSADCCLLPANKMEKQTKLSTKPYHGSTSTTFSTGSILSSGADACACYCSMSPCANCNVLHPDFTMEDKSTCQQSASPRAISSNVTSSDSTLGDSPGCVRQPQSVRIDRGPENLRMTKNVAQNQHRQRPWQLVADQLGDGVPATAPADFAMMRGEIGNGFKAPATSLLAVSSINTLTDVPSTSQLSELNQQPSTSAIGNVAATASSVFACTQMACSQIICNPLRQMVSQNRRRYQADGFNLDLTYITDRIIAMGYPANATEAIYRNSMANTVKFLEYYHPGHYKVFNLRGQYVYDTSKFHNRVVSFEMTDHHPPRLELMAPFCRAVHDYLSQDPRNVVAVHCKAGKGRTGVMICAYLCYISFYHIPRQNMDYYSIIRTHNNKGVTIPSQRRYVYYFSHLRDKQLNYMPLKTELVGIYLEKPPKLLSKLSMLSKCALNVRVTNGDVDVFCGDELWLSNEQLDEEDRMHRNYPIMTGLDQHDPTNPQQPHRDCISRRCYGWTVPPNKRVFLEGDVRISLVQTSQLKLLNVKQEAKKIGHIWFNTMFSCPGFCGGQYIHGDEAYPYPNCGESMIVRRILRQHSSKAGAGEIRADEVTRPRRDLNSLIVSTKSASLDASPCLSSKCDHHHHHHEARRDRRNRRKFFLEKLLNDEKKQFNEPRHFNKHRRHCPKYCPYSSSKNSSIMIDSSTTAAETFETRSKNVTTKCHQPPELLHDRLDCEQDQEEDSEELLKRKKNSAALQNSASPAILLYHKPDDNSVSGCNCYRQKKAHKSHKEANGSSPDQSPKASDSGFQMSSGVSRKLITPRPMAVETTVRITSPLSTRNISPSIYRLIDDLSDDKDENEVHVLAQQRRTNNNEEVLTADRNDSEETFSKMKASKFTMLRGSLTSSKSSSSLSTTTSSRSINGSTSSSDYANLNSPRIAKAVRRRRSSRAKSSSQQIESIHHNDKCTKFEEEMGSETRLKTHSVGSSFPSVNHNDPPMGLMVKLNGIHKRRHPPVNLIQSEQKYWQSEEMNEVESVKDTYGSLPYDYSKQTRNPCQDSLDESLPKKEFDEELIVEEPPGLEAHSPRKKLSLIYPNPKERQAPRYGIDEILREAYRKNLIQDLYNSRRMSQPRSGALMPKAQLGRPNAESQPRCLMRRPEEHVTIYGVQEIDKAHKNKDLDMGFKIYVVTKCLDESKDDEISLANAFLENTYKKQLEIDKKKREKIETRQKKLINQQPVSQDDLITEAVNILDTNPLHRRCGKSKATAQNDANVAQQTPRNDNEAKTKRDSDVSFRIAVDDDAVANANAAYLADCGVVESSSSALSIVSTDKCETNFSDDPRLHDPYLKKYFFRQRVTSQSRHPKMHYHCPLLFPNPYVCHKYSCGDPNSPQPICERSDSDNTSNDNDNNNGSENNDTLTEADRHLLRDLAVLNIHEQRNDEGHLSIFHSADCFGEEENSAGSVCSSAPCHLSNYNNNHQFKYKSDIADTGIGSLCGVGAGEMSLEKSLAEKYYSDRQDDAALHAERDREDEDHHKDAKDPNQEMVKKSSIFMNFDFSLRDELETMTGKLSRDSSVAGAELAARKPSEHLADRHDAVVVADPTDSMMMMTPAARKSATFSLASESSSGTSCFSETTTAFSSSSLSTMATAPLPYGNSDEADSQLSSPLPAELSTCSVGGGTSLFIGDGNLNLCASCSMRRYNSAVSQRADDAASADYDYMMTPANNTATIIDEENSSCGSSSTGGLMHDRSVTMTEKNFDREEFRRPPQQ